MDCISHHCGVAWPFDLYGSTIDADDDIVMLVCLLAINTVNLLAAVADISGVPNIFVALDIYPTWRKQNFFKCDTIGSADENNRGIDRIRCICNGDKEDFKWLLKVVFRREIGNDCQ